MGYAVVASWSVREEDLEAISVEMRRTRDQILGEDPDCLAYEVHIGVDEPLRMLVYEVYRDEAAFQRHARSEIVARLSAALRGRISDTARAAYRIL